jgi:hypothetical protein
LRRLPINEVTARLLPLASGILAVVAGFAMAARNQGVRFAVVFAAMMLSSSLYIDLVQQNRFYATAVLLTVLTHAFNFRGTGRLGLDLVFSAGLGALAVLGHNLLLVYFVIAALAAVIGWRLRWVDGRFGLRSCATGLGAVLVYAFYLRPIIRGWNSENIQSWASAILSSGSELGIPILALSGLGAAMVVRKPRAAIFRWWALLALLSLGFIATSPFLLYFNSRYTVLFALPFWMLAARAVVELADRLEPGPGRWAWFACVALLLAPKFVSHYRDGSRKDFREAARIVSGLVQPGDAVLSNWPHILGYYLGDRPVRGISDPSTWPDSTCYVAVGSNAWEPVLHVPGRVAELVEQVGRRRFDEQSYMVRIYRVWPSSFGSSGEKLARGLGGGEIAASRSSTGDR